MPLFHANAGKVTQLKPGSFSKERDLQSLFETNLDVLLGVRFVASEYVTGERHRGRIDTLGLDQDGSPTIIEYKKTSNENVMNQGLFYLDWLVNHKGDFTLDAQKVLGKELEIDWSRPRLILIAESFSEYDKFAVNRIGVNIELWTIRRYGDDLLYLDPLYVAEPARGKERKSASKQAQKESSEDAADTPIYTLEGHLKGKPEAMRSLFEELREQIFALDVDGAIIEKANKHYMVYKHGRNFCSVWVQNAQIVIWLGITIGELVDPLKMAKDISAIGHWGTGDVEIKISTPAEIPAALQLITQAYQQTI